MSRHLTRLLGAAAVLALTLTACSGAGSDAGGAAETSGDDATGVTVEHAFGSTQVPGSVTDVVTLGWGATEAAIALGVVPAGIEAQTYAVDDNGLLPWVNEALEEAGAEPTILPAGVEEQIGRAHV